MSAPSGSAPTPPFPQTPQFWVLMVYALGRGLEPADAPAVRKVKRDAAKENYRFESLIQGIVTSTPFTMRMAQDFAN